VLKLGLKRSWEYVITERVYRKFSKPVARFLAKLGVEPNLVTLVATILGVFSGFLIVLEEIYLAVLMVFVSQILDCVDGDLARILGKVSRKGAFLDRVLDRFVDAAIIIGIISLEPEKLWFIGLLAVIGSFGVSLSKAMAEAEGAVCRVGIGGRDTRLAVTMIGLTLKQFYLTLLVVATLGFLTTGHRVFHTLKQLEKH